MKLALLVVVSLWSFLSWRRTVVNGFVVVPSRATTAAAVAAAAAVSSRTRRFAAPQQQQQQEQEQMDRIKLVGGGVASLVPVGDRILFDPDAEGMLQGTGSITNRIAAGSNYQIPPPTASVAPGAELHLQDAQHWLEHLTSNIPVNFAKNTHPVTATVLGRARLIGPDAPGDIQHVVLELPAGMHYVEGQSLSVIPPGVNDKGKPHAPRLYSIASTRYGDLLNGRTVSLCVRRAVYVDPVTGAQDDSKAGVCSNFLCDATPGTSVQVAGPVGKTMLLPQDDPEADIIMIATGTGIAPFRGFLHRLFMEHTVTRHVYNGQAWLVLGVPTSSGLLYPEEIAAMQANAQPGQLRVDYAISREMTNTLNGGKLYVQHVIAQNAKEFFAKLDSGKAHVYFCGLKNMMPPIMETLEQVAQEQGRDWNDLLAKLKARHQWHVEVY